MGRYYNGDIEGKFWFGVQGSRAGERFGAEETNSNYINYYTEDLEQAEAGINDCLALLGEYKEKLDKFFKENDSYNEQMLIDAGIDPKYLQDYADLRLGIKIRDCIKEQGYCEFEAEE